MNAISHTVKGRLEQTIICTLAAVFILQQLTHWEPLSLVLGLLVLIAILLLLPHLRGMTFWLTVSFLAIGGTLLLVQKAVAQSWMDAAGINVTIVTLFVFAPLFGIPVRLPEYVEALRRFYETKLRSRSVLFIGTQLLTQIMGVFLNVGAISVVYHLIYAKPHPGMSRLIGNALNRGFAGAILWSPYFAAMTVVLSSLSLNWSALLPYMLGLSLLSIGVSVAVDYKGLRSVEWMQPQAKETVDQTERAKEKRAYPVGLGIYLAAAITVILVLEQLVELPMVLITCMAAALWPLIWCLAKGAMTAYRLGLANHFTTTLPALKKEIALFLAAGFFSGSIGTTGFGTSVPALLEQIPLPISLTFSVVTIALIIVTSMLGLHPIVLVTIIATGIEPAVVQISPEHMAILLLGSWGLSNPLSPATAVNNLLAGLYKKSVFELAKPNYKFAVCMAIVLLIYLMTIEI